MNQIPEIQGKYIYLDTDFLSHLSEDEIYFQKVIKLLSNSYLRH